MNKMIVPFIGGLLLGAVCTFAASNLLNSQLPEYTDNSSRDSATNVSTHDTRHDKYAGMTRDALADELQQTAALLDRANQELAQQETLIAELQQRSHPAPPHVADTHTDPVPEKPKLTPEQIRQKIIELKAAFDKAFENGNGKEALALMHEMAALGPDAYDAALEMSQRIRADFRGPNDLNLSRAEYYSNIGSDTELMKYALQNPNAPEDARSGAVYSLIWQNDPAILDFLNQTLANERDERVLRDLANQLGELRNDSSLSYLIDALGREYKDPQTWRTLLYALANYDAQSAREALNRAAQNASDNEQRNVARTALAMQNPSETGALLTYVNEDGGAFAAGVRVADIVLNYNGTRITGFDHLADLIRASKADATVTLDYFRDGSYLRTQATLINGRLGIDGRSVKKKN